MDQKNNLLKGLKIKETYLLVLIVLGLFSLATYSTLALFTASTEIENVVDFSTILQAETHVIEYVMGNMSNVAGSYKYDASIGGTNYTYSGNEKYVITYANGSSAYDQMAYNRGRLGDATSEVVVEEEGSWYDGYPEFFFPDATWLLRSNVFEFFADNGRAASNYGTRASLAVFSD